MEEHGNRVTLGGVGWTLMLHYLYRFHLYNGQHSFEVWSVGTANAWLSQALSTFNAQGISLNDDLSNYGE